jgi:HEPN domain-containing protein
MSDRDTQSVVQWREALLWPAKADIDVAAARTLLAADQPEPAAFHVQQAVEKALKALLVAAAQDVRRTHDIDQLATIARAHWPAVLPASFALAAVSQWYVTTRYPGPDDVPAMPEEVREALDAVAALIAAIKGLAPPAVTSEGDSNKH